MYGDSSEFVEERLISMSWSHAKEGDVELEGDAPVSMGGCPFIGPAARKRTSVASPNPAIASVVSAANAAHTLAHHETEGARIRGNAVTTMTLTQSPSSTAGGSRRSGALP